MTVEEPHRRRKVNPHVGGAPSRPVEKRTGALVAPGDQIEYGVTYQVQIERQLAVWLKAGVTSTVQMGEDSDTAWKRVKAFVDKRMGELIEEHTEGAKK